MLKRLQIIRRVIFGNIKASDMMAKYEMAKAFVISPAEIGTIANFAINIKVRAAMLTKIVSNRKRYR